MSASLVERAVRSRRARGRVRPLRIAAATLGLVVALGAAAPLVMVSMGTRRAAACLVEYTSPRGPARPACGGEMRWFLAPAHVPWTSWSSRYRAEELLSRLALANYVDAAVGTPDPAALARFAPTLESVEKTVRRGSRRPAMDDLGAQIDAPDLGRSADDVGDRTTLLGHAFDWTAWQVRLHALDAALIDGDVPKAAQIAKRYAEFDPRDEDLRSQIGAVLCLAGDARRGIELLASIQDDRASRRYAAMARDWGEVRAALVACAARAGVPPPPKPVSSEAGRGDAAEPRAALRLRLLPPGDRGAGGDTPHLAPRGDTSQPGSADRMDAIEAAAGLLRTPRRTPAGRRTLLALLLSSGYRTTAAAAADLVRADEEGGELPIAPPPAITAADLMEEPTELRAMAPAITYVQGADRLLELAKGAGEDVASSLRVAAGALLVDAGRSLALAGDGAAGADAMDRAGSLCLPGDAARALARSSAWYVAGDAGRALAELDRIDLAIPGSDAPTRAARAGALIQRAELLASSGRSEESGRAALLADEAAKQAGDPTLDVRARFLRLALAPAGQRLREDDAAAASAGRVPSGRLAWTWLGFADVTAPWTRGNADGAIAATLGAWDHALSAPADERLALRYEVLRFRGDATRWPVVRLALAAALAASAGDVETWLDAFYAIDARRLSRRAYAWSRAEAARWRGDDAAAAIWTKRYRALSGLASDPQLLEIARYAGI